MKVDDIIYWFHFGYNTELYWIGDIVGNGMWLEQTSFEKCVEGAIETVECNRKRDITIGNYTMFDDGFVYGSNRFEDGTHGVIVKKYSYKEALRRYKVGMI